MIKHIFALVLLVCLSYQARASHAMGGEITWTCQGGDYVFELTFYRDCNSTAPLNPVSETIKVWGHPTVTQFDVDFISRTDISPICTEVAGGPSAFVCGSGPGSGNGVGAIEKAIYRSQPISLPGTPPVGGWIFTFDNFARSNAITNLVDPSTRGLTIHSTMYAIPGAPGGCVDNSPQLLQDPYFVSCVGEPYSYNMNAVDEDLDSLFITFGKPLNHILGATYNPPTDPYEIPFESGFSYDSPTPGTGMNASNIPASINASSGTLDFLSFNSGVFTVKLTIQSFRDGVLIAEVNREMQLVVSNCSGSNNAPTIAGPFGGTFETTINAGDLVNFDLNATDVELLQDGSPQNNHLSATGLMFGTNYTDPNSGCINTPCATLNATPLITMQQGVTTTFNWQTTCDHLIGAGGVELDLVPYHFVFKVQDDYCDVPKVSYATVTVNVVNQGIIPAPGIDCIQSNALGDVTINWTPVPDPFGTFTAYEVHSVQSGLLATLGAIGSSSYTDPGVTQQNDYFVVVRSGCNGGSFRSSDTISNIFLDVVNPSNGTAVLQWNDPVTPASSGMNSHYHIYREYPAGTWSLYDSVPYGTNFYIDTIDICDVFLNYQIVLTNVPCNYTSNIAGDQFEDMITPDIPNVYSVSIDTATNNVVIVWDQNNQPDTYGYVIYIQDASGNVVELDTVWGIDDTTYTHTTNTNGGPLTYSVAAFDSCWTISNPPTYQTSAKAPVHTTIFLTPTLDICTQQVHLSWTGYRGWNDLDYYEVYSSKSGGTWTSEGTTSDSIFTVDVDKLENYCFVIEAVSLSGDTSFSNKSCLYISATQDPAFNYIQTATVLGEEVHLRYQVDNSIFLQGLSLQRLNEDGDFEEIAYLNPSAGVQNYVDDSVDVYSNSYTYRIQLLDSCGLPSFISNEAQTILLNITNDEIRKLNYLNWNHYREFDGSILAYNIYRGINTTFSGAPLATLPSGQNYYEDDVNDVVSEGKICYYVEAVESVNSFNISELSQSNEACAFLPPLIYIPNAFMPEGHNNMFKPVISDFDPVNYDFTIFNRWGQSIFQTNDPNEAWTGEVPNGGMAATGTYLYMVTVTSGEGIEIVRRGHVTLLK